MIGFCGAHPDRLARANIGDIILRIFALLSGRFALPPHQPAQPVLNFDWLDRIQLNWPIVESHARYVVRAPAGAGQL